MQKEKTTFDSWQCSLDSPFNIETHLFKGLYKPRLVYWAGTKFRNACLLFVDFGCTSSPIPLAVVVDAQDRCCPPPLLLLAMPCILIVESLDKR
jgi:hypothetical protein